MSDSHRDLIAWQRAMELAAQIYRMVETFPKRETYTMTMQLCGSAGSVASNIAEGKGRLSKKEYIQFLSKARGSLLEVETRLELAERVGYIPKERFEQLFEQAAGVGRVLNGLIRSVQRQLRDDI
ncbi:MAG: four helix bundle protein [Thermoanaerobaculia bacterium]